MEDIQPVKSKYLQNKPHVASYKKKRYNRDPDFRKSVLDGTKKYIKNRYENDPEYREKMKENVRAYRARQKAIKEEQKRTLYIN